MYKAPKPQYAIYATGAWNAHIINGDSARAIIEPNDTYLEKKVITAQIAAITSPTCQFNAKIVPTPDATDFPPVNFKKIDLLCPNITATAASTGKSPIPVKDFANNDAKTTGNAPLKASNKSVMKNHFLPITRLTFVAPVEPEPIVLMSSPVNVFTIIYPVGIEPII